MSSATEVAVLTVPPARAGEFWPHISQHIEKALEYGWNTPEEVLTLIENAQAQCWLAVKGDRVLGVWVTRIEQSERGRYCLVWLTGGERVHEWLHLVGDEVEPWARENGCEELQLVGRKSWVRRLPEYKWTSVVLRKSL